VHSGSIIIVVVIIINLILKYLKLTRYSHLEHIFSRYRVTSWTTSLWRCI